MSDLFDGLQDRGFKPGERAVATRAVGAEVDGLCVAFPVKRIGKVDHVLVPEPVLSFVRSCFSTTSDVARLPTIRHHDQTPQSGFMFSSAGYGAFWLPAAKAVEFFVEARFDAEACTRTEHDDPRVNHTALFHPVVRAVAHACSIVSGLPSPLEAPAVPAVQKPKKPSSKQVLTESITAGNMRALPPKK